VRVPIFNFSGWHDEGYGPSGAVRNFTGLRERAATRDARSPRLMIGPWVHGSPGTGRVGARDFTSAAAIDYPRLVLDWCDLHARGIDRGLGSEPPVRVFVMARTSGARRRRGRCRPRRARTTCAPVVG
jgi:predicted acyl esterase